METYYIFIIIKQNAFQIGVQKCRNGAKPLSINEKLPHVRMQECAENAKTHAVFLLVLLRGLWYNEISASPAVLPCAAAPCCVGIFVFTQNPGPAHVSVPGVFCALWPRQAAGKGLSLSHPPGPPRPRKTPPFLPFSAAFQPFSTAKRRKKRSHLVRRPLAGIGQIEASSLSIRLSDPPAIRSNASRDN